MLISFFGSSAWCTPVSAGNGICPLTLADHLAIGILRASPSEVHVIRGNDTPGMRATARQLRDALVTPLEGETTGVELWVDIERDKYVAKKTAELRTYGRLEPGPTYRNGLTRDVDISVLRPINERIVQILNSANLTRGKRGRWQPQPFATVRLQKGKYLEGHVTRPHTDQFDWVSRRAVLTLEGDGTSFQVTLAGHRPMTFRVAAGEAVLFDGNRIHGGTDSDEFRCIMIQDFDFVEDP